MSLVQPIKIHGGKFYEAEWIVAQMPAHLHYVETHAGGLSVLLAKNPEGVSEVVNDLDTGLSTFWQVLRDGDSFEEFKRLVEATPFSQPEFEAAGKSKSDEDAVGRAVRFFILCRQSRQGLRRHFATLSKNRVRRRMNEQVSSWLTAVEGLPDVHARLQRVVILNMDAIDVIRREDSENTLFYLDPPYLHSTRVTTDDYAVEMTEGDHEQLLQTLAGIEGKFLLSGYRSDLYDSFATLHGWRRVDKETVCTASSATTKPMRIESLWANFPEDEIVQSDG